MNSVNVNQNYVRMPDSPESCGKERRGYSMVSYQDGLYIFGGFATSEKLNDLLCFDIKKNSWNKVVTYGKPPTARCYHSAVIYKTSMFIFGGHDNTYRNDLYEYQFSTKIWKEWNFIGNSPITRDGNLYGAVTYGDRLWIFFGNNNKSALHIWSTSLIGSTHQWEEIEQFGNCPRMIYQNAIAVACDNLYALGKSNREKSLFKFNFDLRRWLSLRDMPMLISYDFNLMVTFGDYLLIMIHQELYIFNLYFLDLVVIKTTTDPNLKHYAFSRRVAVVNDTMYICDNPQQLFKIKLPPKYPDCTLWVDFKKILDDELLCDVEFLVGANEVKFLAHIPIIVARSDWIRNCIRCESQKKSSLLKVKLPNVIPNIFEKLLNYIYTDQLDHMDVWLILDLYQLAEEISLESLKQLIIKTLNEPYLECRVNVLNVVDLLSKAHLVKLLTVKEYCLKFIIENCDDILKSKEIEMLDNFTLLLEIFRRAKLPSDEPSVPPQNEPTIRRSLQVDMKMLMDGDVGKEFSDITLVLDENRIPAHKCILLARCSYFQAMFRSFMPLDNSVRIQISENIPSIEAFESFLKYIYYGEIDLPLEHSSQLVVASSFYGLTNNRLLQVLKNNLKEYGTIENILEVLVAAEQAQEHDMVKYLQNVIADRRSKT